MTTISRLPKSRVDAWDSTPAAPDDDDTADTKESSARMRRDAQHDRGAKRKAKGLGKKRQVQDRFGVLNAFADFTAATLTRGELLVWLVLYRDTKDGTAATSQADIARRAGLCKRTVISALQRLESAGLLKRIHRGGLRRGTSRYRVFGLRNDKL